MIFDISARNPKLRRASSTLEPDPSAAVAVTVPAAPVPALPALEVEGWWGRSPPRAGEAAGFSRFFWGKVSH